MGQAAQVLEQFTGQTPALQGQVHHQIRWHQEKGKARCPLPVHRAEAGKIAEKGLRGLEYQLRTNDFSDTGNVGFWDSGTHWE